MSDKPVSFAGKVTTTGRSSALLLEKPFFKANPEFRQKAHLVARRVAPGFVLVSVEAGDDADGNEGGDPVAAAYLAFLEQDMVAHPERLTSFTEDALSDMDALLDGVEAE